jgi:hypothetical protein
MRAIFAISTRSLDEEHFLRRKLIIRTALTNFVMGFWDLSPSRNENIDTMKIKMVFYKKIYCFFPFMESLQQRLRCWRVKERLMTALSKSQDFFASN